MNQIGNMVATSPDDGHAGRVTQSARKRLNHRGPLSIDVSSAWYFITICADGHAPWVGSRVPRDRADTPSASCDCPQPIGSRRRDGRAVSTKPPLVELLAEKRSTT